MGICSNKYNYRNQAIDDFSQKKLIWEKYGTTYNEDYALINTECCENIQDFYNTPFVALESSIYIIISIQICLVFLPLLYLIRKALDTTDQPRVQNQRANKQKKRLWSYIRFAFTVTLALSVIEISMNGATFEKSTEKHGVNNNMVQFFDNLKSNVVNELKPKNVAETFLNLFNITGSMKQFQENKDLENDISLDSKFEPIDQKVSVHGAINKSFGCKNITVESKLKNGTFLGQTSVDKNCRFNMLLSTHKNTAFIGKFKPNITYESFKNNKRVYKTSNLKELNKDLIREYKNLVSLNTGSKDFENLTQFDP